MRTPSDARPLARRRFGQHFLEPVWAEKVIAALAAKQDEAFLEIGPGRGVLTHRLAARARCVAAFEIDRELVARLESTKPANLELWAGDFLSVSPSEISDTLARLGVDDRTPLRVAGNLPYNVASPILFKLLSLRRDGLPIVDAGVMLQREVAERLLASPGTKEYGVLTVLMRHQSTTTRLLNLPPGAFRPPPKVHSTVVRLTFHSPTPPVRSQALFESLVQAVFSRRRKTLTNALLAHGDAAAMGPSRLLEIAAIQGHRRPETLSVEEFARLADTVVVNRALSQRVSPEP